MEGCVSSFFFVLVVLVLDERCTGADELLAYFFESGEGGEVEGFSRGFEWF